jgi:hypothetical protein
MAADFFVPGSSVLAGAVDTFLVERLGKSWRPHYFVEKHLRGFLKNKLVGRNSEAYLANRCATGPTPAGSCRIRRRDTPGNLGAPFTLDHANVILTLSSVGRRNSAAYSASFVRPPAQFASRASEAAE